MDRKLKTPLLLKSSCNDQPSAWPNGKRQPTRATPLGQARQQFGAQKKRGKPRLSKKCLAALLD
jgi:hypothetical protein